MKRTTIDKRLLAAKHCMSKEPWRYVLNHIKVSRDEVVATDGRVLVSIKNTLEHEDGEDGDILLDADMIKFAEQMMPGSKSRPVSLEEADGEVTMTGQTRALRQASVHVDVEGELNFPDTSKTIPTDTEKLVSVSVELLEKIVRTAKGAGIKHLEIRQGENRFGPMLLVGDEGNFQIVLMPRRD